MYLQAHLLERLDQVVKSVGEIQKSPYSERTDRQILQRTKNGREKGGVSP